MPNAKLIPRQALPHAPRSRDGRPVSTRCRPDCRPPAAGSSQCHCGVCHSSVRALSHFDQHRQEGWCLDLPALGFVEVDGMWATPEGHAAADRARGMLAASRKVVVP